MDYSTPLKALLVFALSASASGILAGIRSVLGFFQGQNSELTLTGTSSETRQIVEKSLAIWGKPGFFESIALGRYVFDGIAILAGAFYLHSLFPTARTWILAGGAILGSFAVSHWIYPMLAQAFSPSLGKTALRLYRLYSFFFMGKLGELLFKAHDLALKRLGIDTKLGFLGETNLQRLAPPQDEGSQDRSGLEEDEKEMIRSIFDLRDTQAKEIMTPRVDMRALEAGTSYKQVVDLIAKEKFSRIPVYKESFDNVLGIFHVMDLMALTDEEKSEGFRITDHMREAYFVPRTKKIGELMREFRLKRIHMAVVVDEYGGTAGIITLEDILEEIVGEIHDEDETELPRIHKLEEGIYIVNPVISLSDLNDELDIALKPDEQDVQVDTLGGLILFIHGKVPEKGDTIRFKEFTFEIMEMEGQKMEKIRLTMPSLAEVGK